MRTLFVLLFVLLCACAQSDDPISPEPDLTREGEIPNTPSTTVEMSGQYLEFLGQGPSGEGLLRRLDHGAGWIDLEGPDELFDGIEHGSSLLIRGEMVAGTLMVASIEPVTSPSGLSWSPTRDPRDNVGEQRVLVVMGNFEDTSFTEPTIPMMEDVFFGDGVGPSMDSYYREVSGGKTWLTGQVYPQWVDLSGSQDCDDYQWSQDAMAAIDDDIDFTEYDVLVFVAPAGSCPYQAYSWPGRGTFSTPDGNVRVGLIFGDIDRAHSDYYTDKIGWVLTHEFGHTLGLLHQGSLACQPRSMATSCNFLSQTSGKLGPMGWPDAGWPPHFNLAHHANIGWLDFDEVLPITESGVYEIAPLACRGDAAGCPDLGLPIGLRIPRRPAYSTSSEIFIEYRQPVGFDAAFPVINGRVNNALEGASVHTDRGLYSGQVDASVSETVVPDTANSALPPAADPLDPQPHEIFEDTESGIQFTTLEATPERLVVDIQLGPEIGRGPEVAVFDPIMDANVTGAVNILAWAADQSGVASVVVEVIHELAVVYTDTLLPIADERFTGVWTVDPTLQCGEFHLRLWATDNAGFQSFDTVTVHVDCADTDGDGVYDVEDNCPLDANPTQGDVDADGIGNHCDPCPADALDDEDGDGVCATVLGDLAGDACVDLVDFSAFATSFYSNGEDLSGDLNGDGLLNLSDLALFAAQMGECGDNCPQTPNGDQSDSDGDLRGDVCDFPRVIATNPEDGATDTDRIAPVTVTFDVPMSSVNWSIEPSALMTPVLSPDGTELTLSSPNHDMLSFTQYVVTIHAAGTTAVDGDAMQQDVSFSFTTGM